MADLNEAIVTKLTGHAGLLALIGARVTPSQLAQRPTLPALTYFRVSTQHVQHRGNGGYSALRRPRYQFDCWGDTLKQARAVAEALHDCLATFAQASNPRIDVALAANDFEDYEPEPARWRVIVDAFIWSQES